ncbi:hypothetical protein FKG94_12255 [Exilibacterium tricleocarpae]|uniref:Uncharacterized protein n=1 Tax=Exilibacterium tricleocarpae TaxID=2591008 RepID=A0A545TNI5_9GAMM|nr:hypothetical protein [Exilibacterium tricleocarpae]TQV78787.1 hypothetical protein FKG94_12255 [Exilibacterium tricleocarpae]
MLFRTRLRIKVPKATARVGKDALGNTIDRRPFLNTVAKTEYDCNDRLGRCVIDIYHSAWRLYPANLLSRSHATLSFFLRGLGVTPNERRIYRDLYQLDTASIWIQNYYSGATHQFDELPSVAPVSSDGEDDRPESGGNLRFAIKEASINDIKVFFCRPFKNQVDYFIPFSEADLLQFSFQMTPTNARGKEQSIELMRVAQKFAFAMLNTLAMERDTVPA